jgi:ribosomal protein S18 acetylase RimI-like enzyme
MTEGLPDLVRLTKADLESAAEVAARAFRNYPLMIYFHPDASENEQQLSLIFRTPLRYGLLYGEVYATSPNLEGLAVWLPFDKARRTFWRNLRSGGLAASLRTSRKVRARQKAFGSQVDAIHRRHAASVQWYLQLLAVDPSHQGKGYGSTLLRSMFARLDAAGASSFLETHVPENVEIYRHHGFKVVEEIGLPGADNVITVAMLREAP